MNNMLWEELINILKNASCKDILKINCFKLNNELSINIKLTEFGLRMK